MVKQDISYLSQEISILRQNLLEISRKLEKMDNFLKTDISTQRQQNQAVSTDISTMDYGFKAVKGNNLPISIGNQGVSTLRQINPAQLEQNSTNNEDFRPSNTQYLLPSTGNHGVPADRQTNQQTHRQTTNFPLSGNFSEY